MKWTKADIKRCCDVIRSLWITNRPLDYRGAGRFNAWFTAFLHGPGKRREVVIEGLRVKLDEVKRRAAEHRETAAAFATSRCYGESTQEMVDRFNGYAVEQDHAAKPLERLIARIEAEGLPPEVETFDPSV